MTADRKQQLGPSDLDWLLRHIGIGLPRNAGLAARKEAFRQVNAMRAALTESNDSRPVCEHGVWTEDECLECRGSVHGLQTCTDATCETFGHRIGAPCIEGCREERLQASDPVVTLSECEMHIVRMACDLRDARRALDAHTAKQFGPGSDSLIRQQAWNDRRGLLNERYGRAGRVLDRVVDAYREALNG